MTNDLFIPDCVCILTLICKSRSCTRLFCLFTRNYAPGFRGFTSHFFILHSVMKELQMGFSR